MKIGAKLKTKAGPDKNKDEFFFIYTKPGGTKIGSVKESTVIGTYERTESYLLTDYAYVKLITPLTYNGTRYQYAYIRQEVVYEFVSTLTTYYAKTTTTSVNIRSTPSTASSTNILGAIRANEVVGTTDGTTSNGFFLFNLAKGGTGWVSRNFITSTPSKGATTPTTEPSDEPISDPAQDSTGEQATTTVENAIGTGWLSTIKWAGLAVLALAVGIVIAKLYQRHGTTKN